MTAKSPSESRRSNTKGTSGEVGWDVTMSLDGFIAGPDDSPGKIFDWYFTGDTPSAYSSDSIPFKLSHEDAKLFDEGIPMVGAIVAGRRTYEVSKAWEGSFFFPAPFFVLTHKAPDRVPRGTTKFTFVTDGIESAIKQAKAAAGGKTVGVMGANTAKQCIEAGFLDAMRVHIAPYLLGDGVRLFDYLGTHLVELERTGVIESSSGVTHLFFNVVK
jgi:dihydrofolate reductase